MRLLVCGDRNWSDRKLIAAMLALEAPEVVIHGGCRGADLMAGEVARSLGLAIEEYPAQWHRYGRGAGPVRNQQMLDEGQPDRVLAFHSDLSRSRGTADMVRRARAAGIPVVVVTQHREEIGNED